MIAILYPLKMDKLSEAYSVIYEELSPALQRSEANVKKRNEALAAKNKQVESDRAKTASEFQAHKKDVMSKGGRPVDALDSWQKKKIEARKEVKDSYEPLGKYRSQWESLKLQEHNDYREEFDSWIGALAEEGYDIDRWDDIELVETFINELNLWGSQDAVVEALMNSEVELDEEDKKGKGSGTKDACYHKVKSRYSVWPSAYASGALVKCRKKGAKNWGNSSKKEGFSDWRDDLQLNEIIEKGTKGKIDFHSGKQTTDTGKKTKEGYPISQEKQVMKTKRVTVNNPKGRKRNESPMGKTIGKLNQVKSKQWKAEDKGDTKTAQKMYNRRKKLSGVLYDKTGNFYDRADND